MPATAFATVDPVGRRIEVPAFRNDDSSGYDGRDVAGIADHYAEHGYVVVRGAIPPEVCQAANGAFEQQVKHDRRAFYRLSGVPERHEYTDSGFMLHGVRDVQSLERRRYGAFRARALDVLTAPTLCGVVEAVLGEPGKLVQSM